MRERGSEEKVRGRKKTMKVPNPSPGYQGVRGMS